MTLHPDGARFGTEIDSSGQGRQNPVQKMTNHDDKAAPNRSTDPNGIRDRRRHPDLSRTAE
jgi:hypothetical protein